MTNSADPDQLVSESTLFAKTGHVEFSKRRVKLQSKDTFGILSRHLGRTKRNYVFEHEQNAQIQIHLTHAQSLCARPDLGLRCPHMSEDTFSHGVVHLI